MEIIKVVTVLSIVIESLTRTILLISNIMLKPFSQWCYDERKEIITAILAVLLSIGMQLDVFTLAQIPFKMPVIGVLLTGLILARGAGVIKDLLDIISYTKLNKKPDV